MKPIAHIENDFPTKFGIPRQSGLVNSLHALHCHGAGIPESRCISGAGGLLPHLADLGILAGGAAEVVAYRSPAPFGRQCPHGRFCDTLTVSSQSAGAVGGAAGRNRAARGECSLPDGFRCRPDARARPFTTSSRTCHTLTGHPEARGGFALPAAAHRLEVCLPEVWLEKVPGIPAGRADPGGAGTKTPVRPTSTTPIGCTASPVRRSGSPLYPVDGETADLVCEILEATV